MLAAWYKARQVSPDVALLKHANGYKSEAKLYQTELCELRWSAKRLFVFLHAARLLSLTFVALTFVCVGLCVMASCVFSGMEDSYTVTCGMPLPCLADTQKNSSGLYCLGKYHTSQIYIYLSGLPHKTVTQETLNLC